jgi:hypothetical protein
MLVIRKAAVFFSVVLAVCITSPVLALRVTEPTAAAHGYPGVYDISGKKLADGEFRQWVENNRLHVVITHKFSAGEVYEEHAQFRQQPELIQEKWSWKESKNGKSQREFAVDVSTGIASAHASQDHKDVSKKINIEPGRTFAGFGFSLALSNLRNQLLSGEQVQLKTVGFSEFPTLGPQIVTVTISHGGVDRMKMSGRLLKGDRFTIHPELPFVTKFFVEVPDTTIWLTNPGPAGFLRWEGPIVLPTDPIVCVDLLSGEKSGPAGACGKLKASEASLYRLRATRLSLHPNAVSFRGMIESAVGICQLTDSFSRRLS